MTQVFYFLALTALLLSYFKSREKTLLALKKAWKSFEGMLPQFLSVVIVIGVALTALTPEQISSFIGGESGWWGVLAAALIGAITLIPGFVAFPLAAALLTNGAGYMQIATFVTSLMMVGVVTLPIEISYFGRKTALRRNALAFFYSIALAAIVGGLM